MPAKLSIHVPGEAVLLRVVADDAQLSLGREAGNDIVVRHDSVSRRHARLARGGDGWVVTDLGSKNGIRLDGARVAEANLDRDCWFALGDVFCEFESIDAMAQANLESRAIERRNSSLAWSARLDRRGQTDQLVADLLRGIVEIAECERGFLLALDESRQWLVRACYAIAPEDIQGNAFSGSRSAVERTLLHRRAVYLSDQRDHAWLGNQASVIARGLRAIACLPLLHGGDLFGVAYADTGNEAKVFTDLDAELLDAFVERASTALAVAELDARLNGISSLLAVDSGSSRVIGHAPHWATPVADACDGQQP